ncbi:MAG: Diguanylate cyclase/phosphodiesterase with and sensor [Alphaproteobacteria bacterium]|nr:Diguanylate cyclase/phosphodiesterase with and sensor [Alphaproteobacteria bacterium]
MLAGKAEGRLDPCRLVVDACGTAEIVGNGAIDDRASEALAIGLRHRGAATLPPLDEQVASLGQLPLDVDSAAVGEAAIFGRIGDQLVHDQRHRRISLRIEQHVRSLGGDPIGMPREKGGGLGVDQGAQRCRPPMIVRQLVVRARKRVDPAVDQGHEILDSAARRLGLADQAADDSEDVAHAMVELRDQQLLALVGRLPFRAGFIRQAQHDLDQGRAQRLGDAQLRSGERAAMALDRLLPLLEALAGRQPRTIRAIFDRLVRIAAPPHRAHQFRAEQDHIVARRPRDRDGEHSRRRAGKALRPGQERGDLVGGEDSPVGDLVQGLDDRFEIRGIGCRPGESVVAVDPDADAVRRYGMGQDVAQPIGILEQGLVRGDRAEQLIRNVASAALELDEVLSPAAFEPHREHLGEQLGNRSAFEAWTARGVMMAGEQAPQLSLDQDRHRHRRADAHVPEIFDVDRRDRSQHRERQVERSAFAAQLRHDRHRHGIHVGDHAQQVALVQLAGLSRNVGRRIVKSEEGADTRTNRFGGHFTRSIGCEAIDHHPVVAGQAAHLARALGKERGHVLGEVQTGDHAAHRAGHVAMLFRARLRLDHDFFAGHVDRHIIGSARFDQDRAEQPFDRVGAAQHGKAVTQIVDRGGREDIGNRPADEGARRQPDMLFAVGGCAGHHPVAGKGD